MEDKLGKHLLHEIVDQWMLLSSYLDWYLKPQI